MQAYFKRAFGRDLTASVVVFLVALPLCMGIAVASGVPAEKGLITGIVGGVVVGALAGSPLQVSGPAAGLAVIVFEIVQKHGISALGPILVAAGAIQLVAGFARLGQWFRAISPAVVHGMLAGIGVLIVAGQLHVLRGAKPLAHGLENLKAIPDAFVKLQPMTPGQAEAALAVGLTTILVMLGWEKLRPAALKQVPGALLGVLAGIGLALGLKLDVQKVAVPDSLLGAVALPTGGEFARLAEPAMLLTAVAVAFIASAETLLSAAAVDRMHDGERTKFNRELGAQGVGNLICGLFGALPMTGVIVRSSANVQAGAATRASTMMHGVWLLALVGLAPFVLRQVPTAALAGVLVVTGVRLVQLKHLFDLYREHGWLPAATWVATFGTVVAFDLLTGVLVGLAFAALELAPHLAKPGRLRLRARTRTDADGAEVRLAGKATFLSFPKLAKSLELAGDASRVHLDARGLHHADHTSLEALKEWVHRRRRAGAEVRVSTRGRGKRLAHMLGEAPAQV